jgi:PST family polysaccharide transporter
MEDLKARTVRGGFAKLCGQAANLALRLAFLVIMARLLDPEDFGLVAMVAVVTGVYDIFSSAGLASATIQKTTVTDKQISTLFWINILVGVVLLLLCSATAPVLVAFYNEPRLFWVTVAIGTGFLFSAAGVQHSARLQRQVRYVELTMIETLALLLSYASGIGMAVGGFGYWALVGSTIALSAANTALMWTIAAWIPGPPRRGVSIRSMLRFGGTITLNHLVAYIAYNFDKLLLGRFWGADALGVYGRAYQLINIPTGNLTGAVGGVVFSALSRLQDDPIRLRSYFLKGYFLVISMTVPITIFCALFADDIVLVVLGPKWADAASIFRLLTPTILVVSIINPLSWLIQSIGLHGRSLKMALVMAPLLIAAYLIGLPHGPNGVAFAFSAAMMLLLVPLVVWGLYNTIISPWDLLLAICRPISASIIAAAFVLVVQLYVGQFPSPFWRLTVGGGVMVSLYLFIFLVVMGHKSFYFDLFRGLKGSSIPHTEIRSNAPSH